jgi:hypothetical protein
MHDTRLRAGTALADLIIAMAIIAVMATIAIPRLARARDSFAVLVARDAAASAIDRARTLATARGTARIVLDPAASELRIEAPVGAPVRSPLRFRDAFAVDMTVDGQSTGTVSLDFNAMGLGVSANRTVRMRRGAQEARLSLSLYGRVRRW